MKTSAPLISVEVYQVESRLVN